ncbi:hypothetical protein LINPERHAP2_LOCUS760 [Linum perenne]
MFGFTFRDSPLSTLTNRSSKSLEITLAAQFRLIIRCSREAGVISRESALRWISQNPSSRISSEKESSEN